MAQIQLKKRLTRVAFADAEKYLTSAVRYSTISEDDVIALASENSGLSKANMAAAFYAINQQIEQFVCNGHGIRLGRLGTLYLSAEARAMDTAEQAGADAVTRLVVRFRQSKYLRDHLNTNVTLSTLDYDASSDSGDPDSGSTDDTTSGGDDDTSGDNPLV